MPNISTWLNLVSLIHYILMCIIEKKKTSKICGCIFFFHSLCSTRVLFLVFDLSTLVSSQKHITR